MMQSVRSLRLWVVRFFKGLTLGKIVIGLFMLAMILGMAMVINESQIPDEKRLRLPDRYTSPVAVPNRYIEKIEAEEEKEAPQP